MRTVEGTVSADLHPFNPTGCGGGWSVLPRSVGRVSGEQKRSDWATRAGEEGFKRCFADDDFFRSAGSRRP